VIVNWNSGPMLDHALRSLADAAGAGIVVVDNASTDDSVERLEAQALPEGVRIVRLRENVGFAGGVNRGFAESDAPMTLVLNPDVRARPGAVSALAGVLENEPRAGAVGGFVNTRYLPRQFPSVTSLALENLGLSRPHRRISLPEGPTRVDQIAAAALMIRREAYDEVGGFDEGFFPAWYEDVDFAGRLEERGWERWFEPSARFDHDGGYSARELGIDRFFEAYHVSQFRYARRRLTPRAIPLLKGALFAGTMARIVARPSQAGGYWRGLKRVLSA
jgi:N-acetylglucosaminyl-diphospho-decaprenol L-rhamnosyltransferase